MQKKPTKPIEIRTDDLKRVPKMRNVARPTDLKALLASAPLDDIDLARSCDLGRPLDD